VNGYYVVSSVRSDRSRIINPCGRIVAETDRLTNIAYYDVNLDYAIVHYDFNHRIPCSISEKYGDRVRISSYIDDDAFIVEPMDESITVEQLQKEFRFESYRQYIQRHRTAYKYVREGKRPPPQKAAHGNRPIYE